MTRGTAGFTVIEVLAAITLMSIALLGITMTGVATTRADSKSHSVSAATALAQAKLEHLRVISRFDSEWGGGPHVEASIDEQGASHPHGAFTRQWVIDRDYNHQLGIDRVSVTVFWSEGEQRSVTLLLALQVGREAPMRTHPSRLGSAGFSAVEMLVAGLLGAIVMATTVQFFSFQLSSMRGERARRSAQMTARTALNFVVRQIEHAGRDPQKVLFSNLDNPGLPPAIASAGIDSIHYRSNLSVDSADTDTIDLWEDATFNCADEVISWVTQGAGAPMALTDGTTNGSHVPPTGLAFRYFDGAGAQVVNPTSNAELASIRRINVSVTIIGGAADTATSQSPRVTLSQDVFLRNVS